MSSFMTASSALEEVLVGLIMFCILFLPAETILLVIYSCVNHITDATNKNAVVLLRISLVILSFAPLIYFYITEPMIIVITLVTLPKSVTIYSALWLPLVTLPFITMSALYRKKISKLIIGILIAMEIIAVLSVVINYINQ